MYRIAKRFAFAASHVLEGLPDGHRCGRLHGHNYEVEVVVAAKDLDGCGFVLDFGQLAEFARWIDDNLDHRHLNDVLIGQPSAENVAATLHTIARAMYPEVEVEAVRVSETPRTWAEYRP